MRNSGLSLAALVAVLCIGTFAGAKDGLWGGENLIADPMIEAGDIVTIVISPAPGAGEAHEGAPGVPAQTAARVVKRLPNGNLVLEARVRLGRGYILIGGEAARADLSADRTVDISRVADLAVVARGLDDRVLADFMMGLARRGPDGKRRRFASGVSVKKK